LLPAPNQSPVELLISRTDCSDPREGNLTFSYHSLNRLEPQVSLFLSLHGWDVATLILQCQAG